MSLSNEPHVFQEHPGKLEALKKRYSESGRFYHNWSHIEQLLSLYGNVVDKLSRPECVLLAIYYHDAIYEAASKTNEEDSAALFKKECAEFIDDDAAEFVYSLIMATKDHRVLDGFGHEDRQDCQYFLDIDMSILGSTEDEYFHYAENIRKEYAVFSDEIYNFGRAKLLANLLAQERIFLTEYFYRLHEETARKNINKEILLLACE